MMLTLSEMQHDALVEIFNISIGRAAATMSRMVNEEITLSVPSFNLMNRRAAAEFLDGGSARRICGVSQTFEGSFNADAILMFPEEKSLEIVRMMVGEAVPLEALSELEQEALSEIGNIILNSCIGTMANIIGGKFTCSLPTFHLGTSREILHTDENGDEFVLLLHIDFIMERHQIQGHVAFLMNIPSLEGLVESVDRFLGKMPR